MGYSFIFFSFCSHTYHSKKFRVFFKYISWQTKNFVLHIYKKWVYSFIFFIPFPAFQNKTCLLNDTKNGSKEKWIDLFRPHTILCTILDTMKTWIISHIDGRSLGQGNRKYLCFVHPIFCFWFFVSFGDEVTKIWKYYIIFIYILQGKMCKTAKTGKKIIQLKWPTYQKPKDENMGWTKYSFWYQRKSVGQKIICSILY